MGSDSLYTDSDAAQACAVFSHLAPQFLIPCGCQKVPLIKHVKEANEFVGVNTSTDNISQWGEGVNWLLFLSVSPWVDSSL